MAKSKKKSKKINPKKEKYAKFHKEKNTGPTFALSMDRDDEEMKNQKDDEFKLEKFLRWNKNPPPQEVSERKMKSKR